MPCSQSGKESDNGKGGERRRAVRARNAERRNAVKAQNARRRQMPNGAKSRKARNPEKREIPDGAQRRGRSALCRSSGFGAVWDFALSGISRRSASGALRHSAPFLAFPLTPTVCRGASHGLQRRLRARTARTASSAARRRRTRRFQRTRLAAGVPRTTPARSSPACPRRRA